MYPGTKNGDQADGAKKEPHLLGREGQKLCEKFLKKKGCRFVARNFMCKTGELDLIMAEPDGTVVFVEVKTRSSEDFADAEGAITKAKQIRMTRAANFFIRKHKLENFPLRFDVIFVIARENGKPEIRHYIRAF